MAKKFRRAIATTLVLAMCVCAFPLQALAAEDTEDGIITNTTPGTPVNNADGTVTVTVIKDYSGNKDGKEVSGQETTTTTTDSNGKEVAKEVSGKETSKWFTPADPTKDNNVPSTTVTIQKDDKGNPVKNEKGELVLSGTSTGTTVDQGSTGKENSETGKTTTTSTPYREVTGSVTIQDNGITVTMPTDENGNITEDALYCPVEPEEYEGKQYASGDPSYKDTSKSKCSCCGKTICGHDLDGITKGNRDKFTEETDKKPAAGFNDGFDMVWTGHGDVTNEAVAVFVKYVYQYVENENGELVVKRDEDGNPVLELDENGNPKIEYFCNSGSKNHASGMMSQSSQFVLKHENGKYFYAYCMDANTGASPTKNRWYHITNIESAIYDPVTNPDGYLTEDEAEHIKQIATYGYWGTNANVYEQNEDGTYVLDDNGNRIVEKDAEGNIITDASVRGSVASLVEMLKKSYPAGTEITINYPTSNGGSEEIKVVTDNLFDGLTESEALAVTQAAIWTFANSNDIGNGWSVYGVLSALKLHNGTDPKDPADGFIAQWVPEQDTNSDARLQALYDLFLSLGDLSEDQLKNIAGHIDLPEEKESTVIPNEGVVTGVGMIIHDKAEDEEYKTVNTNDNADDDVYNVDLSFTLAFVPTANDDLLVYLYDDNNPEADPIIRRLSGTPKEGETYEGVVYNKEDGSYILTGLKLGENTEASFDLQIQGTQYLNEGVYIYQAKNAKGELSRDASQTLVGLAAGTQKVVSSTKLSLQFEVDEKNQVVAERVWTYDSKNPPVTPPEEPENEEEDPGEDPDGPKVFNMNKTDGVVEIPEEQVPLAAAPKTGDISIIWIAMALAAAITLCASNFGKKRETF